MNVGQKEKLRKRLGEIEKHGGAFTVNGREEDSSGVLGGFSCLDSAAVFLDLCNQLDAALEQMRLRQLPNQFIPDDEGDAPLLDFKPNCDRGTCPIGSRWNRNASDEQKEWD